MKRIEGRQEWKAREDVWAEETEEIEVWLD